MKGTKNCHNQCGLSLVELLVAMAIGLVLLGGIYQAFFSSTTTYENQQGSARIQENGRFALNVISKEIRLAGYLGCLSNPTTLTNTLNNSGNFLNNFAVGIEGFEATSDTAWDRALPTTLLNPLGGNDVLTIRGVDPSTRVTLTTAMPDSSADLKSSPAAAGAPAPMADGDIVMISDCQNAAVFQVTNYTGSNGNVVHNTGALSPGNATKNLGSPFATGAEITRINVTSFFLSTNPQGQPALYRVIGSGVPQELAEGVERMQLLYGVDTTLPAPDRVLDAYLAANAVTDWSRVLSVRIALLVRSPSEVAKAELDTATYDLNGVAYDPPDDRRMRQVLTATVGLRNRLP